VDYTIVFDGGSRGNPGVGYGSYRIRRGDGPWTEPVALALGDRVTNNEAEYRSLIAALEDLADRCANPAAVTVEVTGDSQLVLNQLRGAWKVRAGNLRPLFVQARTLADRFHTVRYTWHRRDRSVDLLGH
jgi:ribonuclease HI